MKRAQVPYIVQDLEHKIVLLTGPRQSGKTTLSKQLGLSYDYLNIDDADHLMAVQEKNWDRQKELLILDEFHKLHGWKRFIKGVYDTEGLNPKILITGSAKLDVFRRVGDSLAGRYFSHRLYPIDIKEATDCLGIDPIEAYEALMRLSGFPEPFLRGEEEHYRRWYKTHHDIMLKEDVMDLTAAREVKSIQLLAALLEKRVGSGISYANLASDLQVSAISIKNWIALLENMYMVFSITPYHKNIARSLLKEPKVYHYNVACISDEGAQLENLVAFSLLKHLHFLEDVKGKSVALHYCRTKEGRKVDFLVIVDGRQYLIEVKLSDGELSKHFDYFARYLNNPQCIQLVRHLKRPYSNVRGHVVASLIDWLAHIDEHIV